ncbi:MAG: cobyrinic acid a,c-diamide synthase, partial [SAR324 cluster bacterium]
DEDRAYNLNDLITTPQKANSQINGRGTLDLICSHLELINIDLELALELGASTLQQTKKNFMKVHQRLAKGLEQVAAQQYDLVLIDCPSNFNIVTRTALVASDHLLVPSKPDYLSTLGIDYLLGSFDNLVQDYNDFAKFDGSGVHCKIRPKVAGVFFTMVQYYRNAPIEAQSRYIQQAEKQDFPVFNTFMREDNVLYSDAGKNELPIMLQTSSNRVHQAILNELQLFAEEFINKVGLK